MPPAIVVCDAGQRFATLRYAATEELRSMGLIRAVHQTCGLGFTFKRGLGFRV